MNEDSSDMQSIQDNRRLSSSFSQSGFFVGSPKDSFNVSKWIDDSKKLFTNIIKQKPDLQQQQQVEDFSNVFAGARRPRTQSMSSDISIDDQPMNERRSSFSDRYFTMQMQSKNGGSDKFNTFRTAITSYYD